MASFILEAPLPGGCLEAWPAAYPSLTAFDAYQVSRLAELVHAKNTPLSLLWQSSNPESLKSSHASEPVRQKKKLGRLRCLQDSFVTPGNLKLHDSTASRRKYNKLAVP